MDWSALGPIIGAAAPTLGKVVGGLIPFPGAGLVGEAVGRAIAAKFGVPATPEAVSGALANAPHEEAMAVIRAAADEARAKWPALAEIEKAHAERDARMSEAVNATIRAELQVESFYKTGWRPAAGWLFVFAMAAYGALLLLAITMSAFGGQAHTLEVITAAWPALLLFIGPLCLVNGVHVFARSGEKKAAIETGAAPVIVATPTRSEPVKGAAPKVGRRGTDAVIAKPLGSKD
jgi:hypothetical protein